MRWSLAATPTTKVKGKRVDGKHPEDVQEKGGEGSVHHQGSGRKKVACERCPVAGVRKEGGTKCPDKKEGGERRRHLFPSSWKKSGSPSLSKVRLFTFLLGEKRGEERLHLFSPSPEEGKRLR